MSKNLPNCLKLYSFCIGGSQRIAAPIYFLRQEDMGIDCGGAAAGGGGSGSYEKTINGRTTNGDTSSKSKHDLRVDSYWVYFALQTAKRRQILRKRDSRLVK